ncbi:MULTISPECIES: LysE/ArgO family amino acid transporter [Clostridium]|uniref:LysE/ArgO family amino acid transporter n=1 Tax=Clostridium TaxID=1485 RepID=UPI000826D9D9|nr:MULTISPECIES: LysE family transporter [Clostridium]PJI09342.1 L-lysine permease [Clostridium sp. CT7]
MIKYYIDGLILGITYLAPIGMQNLYVINSAIRNKKLRAYEVAAATIIFDISLCITCFFGIGSILEKSNVVRKIVLLVGCIVVVFIGIKLLRETPEINEEVHEDESLVKSILTCFTTTWFNPQAIIDGSLLLGGFKISMSYSASHIFILGVCTASILWFTGITTFVLKFKYKLSKKVLKIINIVCGIVIIYYGLKLGMSFLK